MQRGGLTQRLCEGWSGIKEGFFEEEGVIKFGAIDPRMKDVVEYLRMLYQEKLIDQTYPTTDTAAWSEVLLGDKTGIFMTHDQAASRIKWSFEQWANLGVTDKYYQSVPPLQPDENTKGYTTIHFPKQRKSYGVYVGVEPGKIDRIMEIWDFNFSDEGFMFTGFGTEGVNYYINDAGLPRPLESYQKGVADGTIPESERFGGKTKDGPHTEFNAIFETDYVQIADARVMYEDGGLIKRNMLEPCRFTDEENSTYTKLYADISTYMSENLDQFIMGVKSMDQWDAFVAEFDKMGIQTCLDIYNAACQRALALLN